MSRTDPRSPSPTKSNSYLKLSAWLTQKENLNTSNMFLRSSYILGIQNLGEPTLSRAMQQVWAHSTQHPWLLLLYNNPQLAPWSPPPTLSLPPSSTSYTRAQVLLECYIAQLTQTSGTSWVPGVIAIVTHGTAAANKGSKRNAGKVAEEKKEEDFGAERVKDTSVSCAHKTRMWVMSHTSYDSQSERYKCILRS